MKKDNHFVQRQSGEIMLEATVVLLPTLILFFAMFSLSFMFYEQALMKTIATEIAADIGRCYKYSERANDIMGTNILSEDDMKEGKLFSSSFGVGYIESEYEELARSYAQNRIAGATLGIETRDLEISCDIASTSLGRARVEVVASQKSEFFLNEIWSLISDDGVENVIDFSGVAYAECSDNIGYTSMINFSDYVTTVLVEKIEVLGAVDDLISSIKDLIEAGATLLEL